VDLLEALLASSNLTKKSQAKQKLTHKETASGLSSDLRFPASPSIPPPLASAKPNSPANQTFPQSQRSATSSSLTSAIPMPQEERSKEWKSALNPKRNAIQSSSRPRTLATESHRCHPSKNPTKKRPENKHKQPPENRHPKLNQHTQGTCLRRCPNSLYHTKPSSTHPMTEEEDERREHISNTVKRITIRGQRNHSHPKTRQAHTRTHLCPPSRTVSLLLPHPIPFQPSKGPERDKAEERERKTRLRNVGRSEGQEGVPARSHLLDEGPPITPGGAAFLARGGEWITLKSALENLGLCEGRQMAGKG
jgi:hypothetical protein